jgi:hypothetical protein
MEVSPLNLLRIEEMESADRNYLAQFMSTKSKEYLDDHPAELYSLAETKELHSSGKVQIKEEKSRIPSIDVNNKRKRLRQRIQPPSKEEIVAIEDESSEEEDEVLTKKGKSQLLYL